MTTHCSAFRIRDFFFPKIICNYVMLFSLMFIYFRCKFCTTLFEIQFFFNAKYLSEIIYIPPLTNLLPLI